MERKYTKGPWKWSEDGSALHGATHIILAPGNVPGGIDKQDGWAALLGAYDGSNEESEANAKLISAAPVLLEAMLAISHSIKMARIPGNDWRRELDLIEKTTSAAIAKALGETE